MPASRYLLLGLCLPLLAGCASAPGGLDFDFRGNAISNTTADGATAPRPEADANGLITYPNYQVAVARRGDTVSSVATRLGLDPQELAIFNGRETEDTLRADEIIALPRRVSPGGGTGTDITSIASAAIDAADADTPTAPVAVQPGTEPVRHRVTRGETAYSVARLYGVSVRALAEWNGLGPDLSVREGQYLIIPLVLEEAGPVSDGNAPGASITPVPPSASEPLPDPIATEPLPDTPDLSDASQPAPAPEPAPTPAPASTSQMQRPVSGAIIRPFSASNEGIDISAGTGSAVLAAADGEVAAITRDTDQIPILVIRHPNNLLTVYANIQNIRVARGDTITRGQTVADVGSGDPSFLHFEVRRGFEAVDPSEFIN
ncbi:LysM peptidoglycan-binding domain-containing protein [Rhodophyticola sp. CCM32]|uniref:M23 family metallopeptidase n=1 Tax=Rhodophyticola sp. CCM32 TaxID=2916397 RepID=UPI00107F5E66|nr:M23 family metallopeptidase [Rhodophyticola sp. CCM32]QBX99547.1 LysM peptidoglycan-binding domain-containing protein [Rhodophyticola sp. CCM32]